MIEGDQLLSICTTFGIEVATEVEENQIIVKQLKDAIIQEEKYHKLAVSHDFTWIIIEQINDRINLLKGILKVVK